MRTASARLFGGSRLAPAIVEPMESRCLLTTYLVDSEAGMAAVNQMDLQPGDVVMLKGGMTFNTPLTLDAEDSGTAENPVVITSYHKVTKRRLTDGTATKSRATVKAGNGTAIELHNVSGVVVEHLNLVGSGVKKNTGSGVLYFAETRTSDVTVRYVNASGFGTAGVEIGAWGEGNVTDITVIYVNAYDNADGIVTYSQEQQLHDVYIGFSKAYDNDGRANHPTPTGSGVRVGGANGAVVEFVEARENGSDASGRVGVGIWAYDSTRVLFRYNESHHNESNARDGGGFDFDGGVTFSLMEFNYSHDNDGSGYGLYQYQGAGEWNNNVIRNNVSVNDGRRNNYAAIDVWAETDDDKLGSAWVLNNQIVQPKGRYVALSRQDAIETLVLQGNVYTKKGKVDLSGIGLKGPAD